MEVTLPPVTASLKFKVSCVCACVYVCGPGGGGDRVKCM